MLTIKPRQAQEQIQKNADEEERAKSLEAFEVYYQLGSNRDIQKLSELTGMTPDVLSDWRELYEWDRLIEERLSELKTAFKEECFVRTMAIKRALCSTIEKTIEQMQQTKLGLPFEVTSIEDFAKLSRSYAVLTAGEQPRVIQGKQQEQEQDPRKLTWADLVAQVDDEDRSE